MHTTAEAVASYRHNASLRARQLPVLMVITDASATGTADGTGWPSATGISAVTAAFSVGGIVANGIQLDGSTCGLLRMPLSPREHVEHLGHAARELVRGGLEAAELVIEVLQLDSVGPAHRRARLLDESGRQVPAPPNGFVRTAA